MTATVLQTEVVQRGNQVAYGVFTVASTSNPKKSYRVDITNGRCDCPAWKFARAGANGKRPLCKHLKSLGYSENTVVVQRAKPSAQKYSEAL